VSTEAGEFHLFHRSADGIGTHHSVLIAPPPVVSTQFGHSIDMSEDGTLLKVAAIMRGTVADPDSELHFFERDGMSWRHSETVPPLFAEYKCNQSRMSGDGSTLIVYCAFRGGFPATPTAW
jgi:hypothetical protein